MPGWLDPAIVLAGVFGMLAFAAVGIARLVPAGQRLAARLEAYEDFPLTAHFEVAAAKAAGAQAALEQLPRLIERVRIAFATLARARARMRDAAAGARLLAESLASLWRAAR